MEAGAVDRAKEGCESEAAEPPIVALREEADEPVDQEAVGGYANVRHTVSVSFAVSFFAFYVLMAQLLVWVGA